MDLDTITYYPAVRRSEGMTAEGVPDRHGCNRALSVLELQTADRNVPKSYKEAAHRVDAAKWIKAIEFEFDLLA